VASDDVRECVRRGICKVNYATDLRVAFTQGVREILTAQPDLFDPKVYLKAGREKVYETVKAGIMLCGSQEKA
jgi:tagatose 1,6-diphosphate aldolase GatY/KbaY